MKSRRLRANHLSRYKKVGAGYNPWHTYWPAYFLYTLLGLVFYSLVKPAIIDKRFRHSFRNLSILFWPFIPNCLNILDSSKAWAAKFLTVFSFRDFSNHSESILETLDNHASETKRNFPFLISLVQCLLYFRWICYGILFKMNFSHFNFIICTIWYIIEIWVSDSCFIRSYICCRTFFAF